MGEHYQIQAHIPEILPDFSFPSGHAGFISFISVLACTENGIFI
jgi:membrane-associated phospholipid phosphatase